MTVLPLGREEGTNEINAQNKIFEARTQQIEENVPRLSTDIRKLYDTGYILEVFTRGPRKVEVEGEAESWPISRNSNGLESRGRIEWIALLRTGSEF